MVIRGRKIIPRDIHLIKQLLTNNPSWGRRRLSQKLCELWDWRRHDGELKDIACRAVLLKLESKGFIVLPERKHYFKGLNNRSTSKVAHSREQVTGCLKESMPLEIIRIEKDSKEKSLWESLLSQHHYLGLRNNVGENIKYLVRSCWGRELACLLYGSPAWKTASRDAFIGWDYQRQERNLHYIADNARFLILPWVKVPHLASHILSRVSKQISFDWTEKYKHPVYLLETFVDRSKFLGTCYKAANWILTGQTKGRSRNDRHRTKTVPIKDVYVYPLVKNFRKALCHDA